MRAFQNGPNKLYVIVIPKILRKLVFMQFPLLANLNFLFIRSQFIRITTQPAFTCSKVTMETLEQDLKYVQSNNKDTKTTSLAYFTTYFTSCSTVSIVNFEHLIAGWPVSTSQIFRNRFIIMLRLTHSK